MPRQKTLIGGLLESPRENPAQCGVFYKLIEEEMGQISRHSRFKDV